MKFVIERIIEPPAWDSLTRMRLNVQSAVSGLDKSDVKFGW
jgi:hypothetical protein